MRCPDCSKMVSYGEPEMEVESEDVDSSDGCVTATVRMVLPCGECGTELKDNEFELSADVDHECDAEAILCTCGHPLKEHKPSSCTHQLSEKEKCSCKGYEAMEDDDFELELDEPESTEDYKPKANKYGKPVPMRYQKHFFGVRLTGSVTCNRCGEKIPVEMEDECQASGFNECV